jgi:hypothetical protein
MLHNIIVLNKFQNNQLFIFPNFISYVFIFFLLINLFFFFETDKPYVIKMDQPKPENLFFFKGHQLKKKV